MTISLDDLLDSVTGKALEREPLTREEMLAVLGTADDDVLDVVAAAPRVRRRFFGTRVKLSTPGSAATTPAARPNAQ